MSLTSKKEYDPELSIVLQLQFLKLTGADDTFCLWLT